MTRKPRFTPLRENGDKWAYTTGLFNKGGSAVKWKPAKRRPTPRIAIGMCSKDALAPAVHVWNVSISAGQKAVCPRTPENPEGRAWFIFKAGEGAKQAMKRMKQTNYLSREKEQRAEEAGIEL